MCPSKLSVKEKHLQRVKTHPYSKKPKYRIKNRNSVTISSHKNRRLNELERLSKQEDRQAYNLLLEHFRESTRKRSLATSTNGSFSSRLTNNAPRPEVIDLCGSSKIRSLECLQPRNQDVDLTTKKSSTVGFLNFPDAVAHHSFATHYEKSLSSSPLSKKSKTPSSSSQKSSPQSSSTKVSTQTTPGDKQGEQSTTPTVCVKPVAFPQIDDLDVQEKQATISRIIVSYRDIQESADAKLLAQIKEAEESKKAKLDVEQSLIDHMSQILVVDDEGEEDEEESAPVRELSVEEKERAGRLLTRQNPSEILLELGGVALTRILMSSLGRGQWLCQEVINIYMDLIRIRSANIEKLPKVHYMNTFFYTTLSTRGYRGVKRWTRKYDLFSFDIILCPIHISGVHWALSVIDFRAKTIKYLDSMAEPSNHKHVLNMLEVLREYLKEEHNDKKKSAYDVSDWKLLNTGKEIPQQSNAYDCGVFACAAADFISRDADLTYSQEDMPTIRQTMVLEIVDTKLFR